MSGHVPPRRGKRKGALSAFNEQNRQSLKAKGKAKPDATAFTYRDDPAGIQSVVHLSPARGQTGIQWATVRLDGEYADVVHGPSGAGLWAPMWGTFTIGGVFGEPRAVCELPVRKQTEPLIGWRAWSVRRKDGAYLLRSVTASVDWEGPVLRSGGRPAAQKPFAGSSGQNPQHGIYAYTSVRQVKDMQNPVVGEIEMSGRVIVHETGFRAEKAVIRRLLVREWALFELPGIVQQLQERYQCEVITDPAAFYAEALK